MNVNEVFLSHASEDAGVANLLAKTLRDHGIRVWISTTNLRGAQQWHDEIGAALRRCDWFAVLLSPHSVNSMWVQRELMFALSQNRFETRIIPIVLGECDYESLSWTLRSFQMVDFFSSTEEGLREILKIWGLGLEISKSAFHS